MKLFQKRAMRIKLDVCIFIAFSAGGLLVLDGIIRPGVCALGTDVVY